MEYRTIKEFYNDVKAGKIDETKVTIMMDNDDTMFYEGPLDEETEICITEANGYQDIEKLYPILFPKATVEWV